MRRVLQWTGIVGAALLFLASIVLQPAQALTTPADPLIIHYANVNGQSRLFVTSPESGWHRLLPNDGGDVHFHAVRGQWVYFSDANVQRGDVGLYRTQVFGNETLRIGTTSDVASVVISPDGQWLAYTLTIPQQPLPAYITSDTNGQNKVVVTDVVPPNLTITSNHLWISPDSQWLLFALRDTQLGRIDIWKIRPDGTDLENLTAAYSNISQFFYGHPTRGTGLVITSNHQRHWLPFDGSGLRNLFISEESYAREISESYGHVVYDAPGGGLVLNSVEGTLLWKLDRSWDSFSTDKAWVIFEELYPVVDTSGAEVLHRRLQPARLLDGRLRDWLPNPDEFVWALGETADGEWFIYDTYNTQTQQHEIWRAQDAMTVEILATGRLLELVGWSPNHEWVLFSDTDHSGEKTLYRMRPDGTEQRALLSSNDTNFRIMGWIEWTERHWSLSLMLVVAGGLLVGAILFRRRV